ncbi:MAG: Transglutaminase-like superfamily [Idiomarinaceae bacterium HL-53]|nr:MAG: Transglutaminase-like superfamily [Idiomarinaceae bacterium HL-53]CUS48273.1 hypothetical protein Ga0003345_1218 [Idiomarinaceae bacterium HL-53]
MWASLNVIKRCPQANFFCLLSCCLFLISPHTFATSFTRQVTETEAQTEYRYQWQDQYERTHQISFQIPTSQSQDTAQARRHLAPARMQRQIVRPLQRYAQEQGWYQLEVKYNGTRKIVEFDPNIRDREEAERRVRAMQRQAQREIEQLLAEHYLAFLTIPPNQRGIAPDHVRIAQESMGLVEPVSTAFYHYLQGKTPREYIEVIASFVQSIPYSELTDRLDSSGAGFNFPLRVIAENQGDCDSKVTLMAAILRNLMPNLRMGIIYLPQHALFGVAISAEEGEITVYDGEAQLLIIEPTGPAKLRLGEAAQVSQVALANGAHTIRLL